MERSPSIKQLAAKVAKIQGEMDAVAKDATNPHYKSSYATLAAVMAEVMPRLSAHGIALLQPATMAEGRVVVETVLVDSASDEWVSGACSAIPQGLGPQQVGATITYLRRYGLSSLLGVATEDDDGETAHGRGEKEAPANPAAPATAPATAPPADDGNKKRHRVLEMCMEIAGGDPAQAGGVLEDLTTWKGEDGTVKRKGYRNGNEFLAAKLSDKAVTAIYLTAKDALATWRAAHEQDKPPEIPF
jgi:hypothetical protein